MTQLILERSCPSGEWRAHCTARPARHVCPVGRLGHLEVVHASHMVNDAVAGRGYESRLTQRPGRVLKMNLTESEAI